MGACCGKGNPHGLIGYQMQEIKVEKFDDLFKTGGDGLQKAEKLREALLDYVEDILQLTNTDYLKLPNGEQATLKHAVTIWMASVGAQSDLLETFKSCFSLEDPYVTLPEGFEDIEGIDDDNKAVYGLLKEFVAAAMGAPATVQSIVEDLQATVDKAKELKDTAKDDFTAAGLSAMDSMKAMKALGANVSTLTTGITQLQELLAPGAKGAKEFAGVVSGIADILKTATEISNKAKKDKTTSGKDIAKKYMPGDKYTDAEIAAKEKKEKKKEKKEKKAEEKKKRNSESSGGGDEKKE